MFPDSEIAKNMSIGKTKSMYLIKHGIEADIKKFDCYVTSFDDILNEKTKTDVRNGCIYSLLGQL